MTEVINGQPSDITRHEESYVHDDIALNAAHRSSNGSDHTFIDQSVETIASPVFAGLTLTGGLTVDTDTLVVDAVNHTLNGTNLSGDNANFNLFLGTGAFDYSPGENNVGIGYQAGYYNDSTGAGRRGDQNIYIGFFAGRGTLAVKNEGYYNVGIGVSALGLNAAGNSCFGLGYWALYHNVDGNSNIGIGFQAGRYNEDGSFNVLIGNEAGEGVSGKSYSNNTFIGSTAGQLIETGSSDIFIGYKAGYRQTTLDNLLIIDRGLANGNPRASAAAEITDSILYGVMADAPADQTLRINASTLVTGGLTVNTNTLVVNPVTHKVGIGIANPQKTLDITGTFRVSSDAFFGNAYFNTQQFTGAGNHFIKHTGGTAASDRIIYRFSDNEDVLIIAGDGRVGINELSPQDTLEVNGTVLVKDALKFTQDDGNEYIDSLADGYMDYGATTGHRFTGGLTVDTNTLVVDDVNHRVGIGGAPGRLCSVIAGAETAFFQITNSTVGIGANHGLEIYSTTGGGGGIKNRESGDLTIGSGGSVWLDAGTTVYMDAGNGINAFREAGTTVCFYRSSLAFAQMQLAVKDNVGNQFILTNYDSSDKDHDHDLQTNPTFYIHSDLRPDYSNNQWGSFAHDQENFIIATGANEGAGYFPTTIENAIVFAPRGTEVARVESSGMKIGDGTNQLLISNTGVVTMEGTAKRDLTLRADLNTEEIRKEGVPEIEQVDAGAFWGYGMPIWNAVAGGDKLDKQQMFFSETVPGRWDGASDITFHVLVCLSGVEDVDDKFKFQFSWNQVGEIDVVPTTYHDTTDEITIVDGTQYATYMLDFVIDYNVDVGDVIIAHDELSGRLRRVDSTGTEVDNEIIVLNWHTHYPVNKMFKAAA